MNEHCIPVKEITGSEFATLLDDAERVFAQTLDAASDLDIRIVISFEGIRLVTSRFLHACIAEVYNPDYQDLHLPDRVSAKADNSLVSSLIKKEISEAKKYFLNANVYDAVYSETFR